MNPAGRRWLELVKDNIRQRRRDRRLGRADLPIVDHVWLLTFGADRRIRCLWREQRKQLDSARSQK